MTAILTRLTVLFFLAPVLGMVAVGTAAAQDTWSFVLTPQVWVSHIEKNGLVPSSSLVGIEPFSDSNTGLIVPNLFTSRDSSPVDSLNPQWGLQLAAQKGRWTLAAGFQYVTFETRTDLFYTPSNGLAANPGVETCVGNPFCIRNGERAAQEFVNTTRMDVDFAASYLFPDVVPNTLDFSVGAGVKAIYATASRQWGNLSPFAAFINSEFPPGLYRICERDDCSDRPVAFKDRVKTESWLYGVTIPMSAVFHLTNDGTWLLPLSFTPFLGAETRDDRNVIYALTYPPGNVPVQGDPFAGVRVKRLDGTTFAYGATTDVTLRWILNEHVSTYAGMRVQYIEGHEKYLAYGPLFGMSVRFGGK